MFLGFTKHTVFLGFYLYVINSASGVKVSLR